MLSTGVTPSVSNSSELPRAYSLAYTVAGCPVRHGSVCGEVPTYATNDNAACTGVTMRCPTGGSSNQPLSGLVGRPVMPLATVIASMSVRGASVAGHGDNGVDAVPSRIA